MTRRSSSPSRYLLSTKYSESEFPLAAKLFGLGPCCRPIPSMPFSFLPLCLYGSCLPGYFSTSPGHFYCAFGDEEVLHLARVILVNVTGKDGVEKPVCPAENTFENTITITSARFCPPIASRIADVSACDTGCYSEFQLVSFNLPLAFVDPSGPLWSIPVSEIYLFRTFAPSRNNNLRSAG